MGRKYVGWYKKSEGKPFTKQEFEKSYLKQNAGITYKQYLKALRKQLNSSGKSDIRNELSKNKYEQLKKKVSSKLKR